MSFAEDIKTAAMTISGFGGTVAFWVGNDRYDWPEFREELSARLSGQQRDDDLLSKFYRAQVRSFSAENELAGAQERIQQLEAELQEALDANAEWVPNSELKAGYDARVDDLTAQVEDLTTRNQRQAQLIQDLDRDNDQLHYEIASLSASRDRWASRHADVVQLNHELRSRVNKLEGTKGNVVGFTRGLREHLKTLNDNLAATFVYLNEQVPAHRD